jgi:hypothetical protein
MRTAHRFQSKKGGSEMKRLVLVLLVLAVVSGSAFGATLNLKATWTANTETDMKEYRLYRTDGTRTLIGTVAHPTITYNFSVTVADGTAGTMTFVLVAVDTNSNISPDSATASYPYNTDVTPPAAPKGMSIAKQ